MIYTVHGCYEQVKYPTILVSQNPQNLLQKIREIRPLKELKAFFFKFLLFKPHLVEWMTLAHHPPTNPIRTPPHNPPRFCGFLHCISWFFPYDYKRN